MEVKFAQTFTNIPLLVINRYTTDVHAFVENIAARQSATEYTKKYELFKAWYSLQYLANEANLYLDRIYKST